MKNCIIFLLVIFIVAACSKSELDYKDPQKWEKLETTQKLPVRAVHLLHYDNDELLAGLEKDIPKLAELGINTVFLEVDYHFTFESHPELRQTDNTITKEGAKQFTEVCKKNGISIIPEFQCIGHQSWAEETFKLLTEYPEFDLTPGAFPNNDSIYCREWDVTNPKVLETVTPLLDEIVEAFDAKGLHIGSDEVFLLGSDESPNTKGKDPAKLYAKAINDLHDHIVKKSGLEMYMWADRLIDANTMNYGDWESSSNGTAPAVDMIPKDIVMCDWHYETFEDYPMEGTGYPSIDMFLDKGFRVIPTSFRNVETMENLLFYSMTMEDPKMLGHLFTLWSNVGGDRLVKYPPMVKGLELAKPYFGSMK